MDRIASATLCLVNQQRALAGIAPLRLVAPMTSAATGHSLDMVARNYLAQVGPAGDGPVERLTQSGYLRPSTGGNIAENLAGEIGSASTPAATLATWMSSPTARAVILNGAYTDTGIGVTATAPAIAGSGPGATYTEDFGGAF